MAAARATATQKPAARLARLVVLLTLGVAVMLLAFAVPAMKSGPHGLPIGVSGPAPAVQQLTGMLATAQPGAFSVTTLATADAVTTGIKQRDLVGGIALGADGVTVMLAGAAGTPYATALKSLGAGIAATGKPVTYVDVAPLTPEDPMGAGVGALGLPIAFGGMAAAVLMVLLVRGPVRRRLLGAGAFAVITGVVAAAMLQFVFHSVAGNYWLTATGLVLGFAAISLSVLGFASVLGRPGLGLGALLTLFVSSPLAGMATGPQWLPQPWGTVGQLLPLGAAGTVVRSAAFFDGNGMGQALVVLVAWILVGLALIRFGARTRKA